MGLTPLQVFRTARYVFRGETNGICLEYLTDRDIPANVQVLPRRYVHFRVSFRLGSLNNPPVENPLADIVSLCHVGDSAVYVLPVDRTGQCTSFQQFINNCGVVC